MEGLAGGTLRRAKTILCSGVFVHVEICRTRIPLKSGVETVRNFDNCEATFLFYTPWVDNFLSDRSNNNHLEVKLYRF